MAQKKSRVGAGGEGESRVDWHLLGRILDGARDRALFVAARLGCLRELRRGDERIVRDLAEGIDYYWAALTISDAGGYDAGSFEDDE